MRTRLSLTRPSQTDQTWLHGLSSAVDVLATRVEELETTLLTVLEQVAEMHLRILFVMHSQMFQRKAPRSMLITGAPEPPPEILSLWQLYGQDRETFLARMEREAKAHAEAETAVVAEGETHENLPTSDEAESDARPSEPHRLGPARPTRH